MVKETQYRLLFGNFRVLITPHFGGDSSSQSLVLFSPLWKGSSCAYISAARHLQKDSRTGGLNPWFLVGERSTNCAQRALFDQLSLNAYKIYSNYYMLFWAKIVYLLELFLTNLISYIWRSTIFGFRRKYCIIRFRTFSRIVILKRIQQSTLIFWQEYLFWSPLFSVRMSLGSGKNSNQWFFGIQRIKFLPISLQVYLPAGKFVSKVSKK